MKYIDLHTHIAYGLDDGAQTLSETIEFLNYAKEHNYETIVLTPHISHSNKEDYLKMYDRYLEIKEMGDVNVALGNEILVNHHIVDLLKSKQFYTINNSSYILLEGDLRLSYREMLDALDDHLNEILSLGYKPVIAHIERYYRDEIDLDYVEYLRNKGCVIQVNTSSLLSKTGYKKVRPLLEKQYVDIIASDAHDLTRRKLNMGEAYFFLKKKQYNLNFIDDMMYNHPKSILDNKLIDRKVYKKRNIISILLDM